MTGDTVNRSLMSTDTSHEAQHDLNVLILKAGFYTNESETVNYSVMRSDILHLVPQYFSF